jgi:hypothetical protein
MQRGGIFQDYIECKCLHKSTVHYCAKCRRRVAVIHPGLGLGRIHDNESLSSDDSDEEEEHNHAT